MTKERGLKVSVDYHPHRLRLHPVAHQHLSVHKYHTKKSFNELINFLIKEALETERIKQKLLDMYLPSVSQYMIRDWRDNYE